MPTEVHYAEILVKTEFEDRTVVARLNRGEKFTNVAREVPLCPSKKRSDDLGTSGRG